MKHLRSMFVFLVEEPLRENDVVPQRVKQYEPLIYSDVGLNRYINQESTRS